MRITDGEFVLIDHDVATGRCTWMAEQDGQYVFRVDMPLNDVFDQNHEAFMETLGRKFGDYNRIASVPHHLLYSSGLSEAIDQQDSKFLNRWINDSDHQKFRTSRGSV